MTVSARPDIYLVDAKASKDNLKQEEELDLTSCKASKDDVELPKSGGWQFDFGDGFGCGDGATNADPLTDEDTVTSMASKETLAWSSRGDKQEMGSYGVHEDAQRESLRLVEESKDFGSGCFKGEEGQGTCWVAQARVPSVQESPAEGLFGLPRKRLWGGLGETAASKKGRREDRAGSRPRSNHQHAMALYPHQLV